MPGETVNLEAYEQLAETYHGKVRELSAIYRLEAEGDRTLRMRRKELEMEVDTLWALLRKGRPTDED